MKSISSVGIAVISGSLLICHLCTFVSCKVACGTSCAWNSTEQRCSCPAEVQRKNLFPFGNQRDKRSSLCGPQHHHSHICRSIGDPHITTFQGTKRNFYNAGVFTLVKLDSRSLWIQVNQLTCGSYASCTCGVMVREGNVIIGITSKLCQHPRVPTCLKFELESGANDFSPDVYTTTGGGWKILLLSGIVIEVYRFDGDFMDVSVTGLSSELGQYSGLCSGNFEGSEVPQGQNFFNIMTPEKVSPPCGESFILPICECKNNNFCINPNDNWLDLKPRLVGCGKRKRQIDEVNDGSKYDDTISLDELKNDPIPISRLPGPDVVDRKRNMGYRFFGRVRAITPNTTLSEEDGRRRCDDALRLSPIYELCSGRVDTSAIVKTCALDVQLLNDYGPTKSVPTEFETVCLDNIRLTLESYTSADSSGFEELTALLIKVEKLVCPSQCSQKGRCVDSKCQCNEGFMGADCSLRIGQAPVVERIIVPVCDIRKHPCKQIHLVASDLTIPENVVCKMRSVDDYDGAVPAVQYSTPIISDDLVLCNLPLMPVSTKESISGTSTTVFRVQVSISNDGQTYSQEVPFTVLDGHCMQCPASQDTPCQLKENTCSIGGRCYKAEESCRKDAAKICKPSKCTTKWTGESSTNCDDGFENCTYKRNSFASDD